MLSRREVKQQVSVMQTDIRRMSRDRNVSSNHMLPSVRELAQQYGISSGLVSQSLKALADEGIIYSLPRLGSFLGRPNMSQDGIYLLIAPRPQASLNGAPVQVGFEERIAQLGGACLTLDRDSGPLWEESGRIPPLAGVFEFDEIEPAADVWQVKGQVGARVKFGAGLKSADVPTDPQATDRVYFDNVKGGQQATEHLLDLGHTNIAFLGLLGVDEKVAGGSNFLWSQEREDGWRLTLENSGYSASNLLFLPTVTPTIGWLEQVRAARQAAERLVLQENISAVVATNSYAARGLFEALEAAQIPRDRWPNVVCFDTADLDGFDSLAHLTALRLPWEDLGRAAAELLWERSHGQLDAEEKQRLVPLRLIKRLTCRRNWAQITHPPVAEDHTLQSRKVVV